MEKNYKKNYKKNYEKEMDLSKDLKIMIYTNHEILVLIKNHLNCLKDNIFKYFLRSIKYFQLF